MLTSRLIKKVSLRTLIALLLLVGGLSWVVGGCKSSSNGNSSAGESAKSPILASESTGKGGAQLWAENCSRCHNIRPPEYYSDAQWSLIVHHMRLRANLTGEEAREITKFLQSAN